VGDFTEAARLIERGTASHAFPAAAIEVGDRKRVLWNAAFGRLTYAADAESTTPSTLFDLASLTKVIATTTLVMRAVDAGTLALDDRVADRLSAWRGTDREHVTIADLLEHASGLTAFLPFFRDHHGRAEFERAICTLPLEYAPRTQSIYSDLGFMLLAFILQDVNGAPLAAQFDQIFRLQAEDLLFNPPRELRARCAPTELDLWRGRLLQGEVHDENTWELGGAAGHAGLFGTAAGVGVFARAILSGLSPDSGLETGNRKPETGSRKLGADSRKPEAGNWKLETLTRFVQKSTVPGSSRALGWDTMLPTSSCGTRLSPRAIGHTGFTGTSLWIDPAQDLYVVFLTNRVHPTRDNNQIQSLRRRVHDAVVAALSKS
jgi:CubicO group peptidase (beta-lactamase class C family)